MTTLNYPRRFVLTAICLTVLVRSAFAAPAIIKVEPPNWWVPHTRNPIQVLLTGSDLKGAVVTAAASGFKVDTRYASDDGKYLFAYVTINQSVKPGKYKFNVKGASGASQFEFALDAPLNPKGRFQGFGPEDVIYLLMPDRFANGDPSNDTPPGTGARGAANRANGNSYHGGDLKGIREHLPYLKDLGATGFWMTPVYKNTMPGGNGAYHGYSSADFYDVEPRFGTMKDLKELVDAAHAMGLKVVQDQVGNHSGPAHPFNANPPTPTWFNEWSSRPHTRNDYNIASLANPYDRPSTRYASLEGWFAGSLPDFNQTDPLCSDYLVQNALWWIGMTGIDAIRQDTYPYAFRSFWEKWQTAIDKQYPTLVVTGETTANTPAVLSFFQGGIAHDGIDTHLKSLLDFPLEYAIRDVFGKGQPMTRLTDVLAQDSLYLRPELLVAFIGNHDQDRFLSVAGGTDINRLYMAQAFLLTTRRTVHLYYGDELAMTGAGGDANKRLDVSGGFPGDTVNAFTPEGRTGDVATVFNRTRDLLQFRKSHPAIMRGSMMNLLVSQDRYAYIRSSPEEHVLVILNRAGSEKPIELKQLVDDAKLTEGMRFKFYTGDGAELVVTGGNIIIEKPVDVGIYWASAR